MEQKRRMIIAPNFRQILLFCRQMGFNPRAVQMAFEPMDLHGLELKDWEVWWLDRMWPCRTREDVRQMEYLKSYAKFRGADLRRWWT